MGARDAEVVRKMASMLKSGATMLERTCPSCRVPLFKLKSGEVICPSCGQKFVIVESEEEELEVYGNIVISQLERTAIAKIAELNRILQQDSDDLGSLQEMLSVVISLLRIVDFSRQVRRRAGVKGR